MRRSGQSARPSGLGQPAKRPAVPPGDDHGRGERDRLRRPSGCDVAEDRDRERRTHPPIVAGAALAGAERRRRRTVDGARVDGVGHNLRMRVYLGSDHAGFEVKGQLIEHLKGAGHEPIDCGAFTYVADDDYPPPCVAAATRAVADPGSLGDRDRRLGQRRADRGEQGEGHSRRAGLERRHGDARPAAQRCERHGHRGPQPPDCRHPALRRHLRVDPVLGRTAARPPDRAADRVRDDRHIRQYTGRSWPGRRVAQFGGRQCRRTSVTSASASARSSSVGRLRSRARNARSLVTWVGPAPTRSRKPAVARVARRARPGFGASARAGRACAGRRVGRVARPGRPRRGLGAADAAWSAGRRPSRRPRADRAGCGSASPAAGRASRRAPSACDRSPLSSWPVIVVHLPVVARP